MKKKDVCYIKLIVIFRIAFFSSSGHYAVHLKFLRNKSNLVLLNKDHWSIKVTSQRKFHPSEENGLFFFPTDTVSVRVMGQKTTALSAKGLFIQNDTDILWSCDWLIRDAWADVRLAETCSCGVKFLVNRFI